MTTEQATPGDKTPREIVGDTMRDLTERLIAAGQARGLSTKRLSLHVLVFTQPLHPEADNPASKAIARALFQEQGLSQTVALLPDDTIAHVPGQPLPLAWYWWWKGERGVKPAVPLRPGQPGRAGDEKERLADAEDIDYAIVRISQVIRLVDSSV